MSDKSTPMDPTAREGASPGLYVPRERLPYAMEQLISEVEALFPEVAHTESRRNQRGVAFDVQFDLTGLDADLRDDAITLFDLLGDPAYNEDQRIEEVVTDQLEWEVLVSFRNNVQIMDDRTAFGLGEAWTVLRGDDL